MAILSVFSRFFGIHDEDFIVTFLRIQVVGDELAWPEENTKMYYINKWIGEINDTEVYAFFNGLFIQYIKEPNTDFRKVNFENAENKDLPLYKERIINSLIQFFKEGKIQMPKPISIFISYAYDSDEHKERVESFVEMLRQMGFDAKMDSMLKAKFPDLDQLMTYGLKSDKIIVILSPEYKRKADNNIGGVWKEFKMIADDLEKNPKKYIFVSFDPYNEVTKEKISPIRIGNRWIVDLDKGRNDDYNELVSFIKEEKEYPFSNVNPNTVHTKPKKINKFQ